MREFAKAFYSSKAWKDCRAAYAASVGGLCERCLARGIYRPGEIVHHKTPLTPQNISDPSVSLSWNNLELLCRDCHAEVHDTMYHPSRRWKVDEFGKVKIK